MKKGINVLSLFDGMSCGQIALKELGIKVNNYYASEIDKHAIQQTQHNFPDTIQLGSVTDIDTSKLPKIDLLIGGSPCQGFSFAGKQLNFNDPRSALFFEYVRMKKELNPTYFMLENVNMKREYLRVISEHLKIFPININSNLVSAQNRNRWYWSNIKTEKIGFFGDLWTGTEQPKDRGIYLKDILQPEKEIDKKYYLSSKMQLSLKKWGERNKLKGNGFKPEIRNKNEKSCALTTGSMKSSSTYIKLDKQLNKKKDQLKAGCLTAGGNSGGNHSDMDIICVAMRGRETDNKIEQKLEPRTDDKTNCLTSVSKDNLICYNIKQKVKVRKHEVDIISLKKILIKPKGLTNKKISTLLDIPVTKIEHWFRKDKSFSIPDAKSWKELKKILNIKTKVFDKSILEFIEKDSVFEQSNRVYDTNGKNPTLLAGKKDNLILQVPEATKKGYEEIQPGQCVDLDNINSETRRGRKMENKSNCLMSKKTEFHKYTEDYKLRRLTPVECARLQTIPDWYKWIVSDTQIYKMLGNGWTVDIIKHIFKDLKNV